MSNVPHDKSEVNDPDHRHFFTIHVNERPVRVGGPHTSGLAIKEAAIAQGVKIELDFILSEEFPDGRNRIVADDDQLTINDRSRFRAVADDDNS